MLLGLLPTVDVCMSFDHLHETRGHVLI